MFNATLNGYFKTDMGRVDVLSFVHTKEMVIYLKAEGRGKEDVTFEFVPAKAMSPRQAYGIEKKDFGELKEYVYNPEPYTEMDKNVTVNVQPLTAGGENLRAECSFLVSAKYGKGKTKFVKVKSLKGGKCNLNFNFGSEFCVKTSKGNIEITDNINSISINMNKGEEVTLLRKGASLKISPVKTKVRNAFGRK